MTVIRKLALSISETVVRWAAPGCKEWAEGLARELAFIESDWRALRWSIGSTRVLLEPREAPIGSLAEVPGAAHRFVDSVRTGSNLWVILLQGPIYLFNYFWAKSGQQHLGCALVVFGTVAGGINILIERLRLKEPWRDDVYDDQGACALFYKAELERQRAKLWMVPFVFLCVIVGYTMSVGLPLKDPFVGGLGALECALLLLGYLHLRRKYLRRIERLNSLLADTANGGPR
jgi:hypothetical protein